MSIWTSKAAGLAAAFALSGCLGGGGGGARTVNLGAEGAPGLAVAAPQGFCVAPDAVARVGASDFVAFARCMGAPGAPALLTATVAGPGSAGGTDPDAEALAAFFTSDEGRAALSRAGRAGSVTVHEVLQADGAVLVRLTDRAARGEAGETWRAVVAVGGRLVTLSVAGGLGTALSAEAGRQMIGAFVRAMRAANRDA
ncbi:MAG: cation transport ATPase [Gemmobacter sp.]